MKSLAIQHGQTEIGILVGPDGHEWSALGSSVNGRHVSGYTKRSTRGHVSLTKWNGATMLDCRSEIVERYRHECHEPIALVFSLTNGRFIVGYALDDSGSLFRGELKGCDSADEAAQAARSEAEYWMERDADDEEQSVLEDTSDDSDEQLPYFMDVESDA